MKRLVEWCFDFTVRAKASEPPVTWSLAEQFLDEAGDLADEKEYGVGGGPKEIEPGVFHLCFGLTATLDDQLIPEDDAADLMATLRRSIEEQGYVVEGGFREFTEEESSWMPD